MQADLRQVSFEYPFRIWTSKNSRKAYAVFENVDELCMFELNFAHYFNTCDLVLFPETGEAGYVLGRLH